ncbi:hypothetical protein, partial [Salipaludibacillus neizhouensis]|uniref:hypothetical protein n=1 Tax=Salipaludibacillus neizhouensis TaxID=885475 RepID=UPI001C7DF85D
ASGFLQIPSHDGHPCLPLTVPTTKSVVDFHHQVVRHAGHTRKGAILITELRLIVEDHFSIA